MRSFFFIAIILGFMHVSAWAVDFGLIEKQLTGGGVDGWIHGAVDHADQMVFTYRTPGDFFDHAEFPVLPANEVVKAEFKKLALRRHDQVTLRGKFLDNFAPIHHILVEDITLVKKYEPAEDAGFYHYQTQLPQDLLGKTEIIANVHAVAAEGHVVVLEYGDAIVPVPVKDNSLTKTLYRNDKVRLRFKIQTDPKQPSHLIPDPKVDQPITVLQRIADLHGKQGTLEGNLILFPKSPEIVFNVFAVQQVDPDGFSRQWTLVNFDDQQVFAAIRSKLQGFWDEHPKTVVNARNKLLNTGVRIRVSGTFNEVDPGQANPQVLLSGPDAITLVQQNNR
jgi:hypothetical protein